MPNNVLESEFEKEDDIDARQRPNHITYIRHKGVGKVNVKSPWLLDGYGGFRLSLLPFFDVLVLFFLERFRGVFGIVHVRGGCEFGEEWWQDATGIYKQQSFTDFSNGAKFLIDQKWASAEKIGIMGTSNGGLLMAAVVNQTPELFGAVWINCGVLDMSIYPELTVGEGWEMDYGSIQNEEEFKAMIRNSSVHNIRIDPVAYPGVLADGYQGQPSVASHTYEYMAEIYKKANKKAETKPILMRQFETGHGEGMSVEQKMAQVFFKNVLNQIGSVRKLEAFSRYKLLIGI